ncbi:DUF982 domain-containing protein [Bosea thiooxidans]
MAAADSDSALNAAINQTGSMLLRGGYGYGNVGNRSPLREDCMMISDDFERPVVILTGFGHPATIASAMEAYMFLADWPASRRDAVHGFALKACLAAIRGEIEPETARGLFASWAEKHDLLAPDVAAFVSSRKEGSRGHA